MYGSFHTNVCKLLSALNGSLQHQRPTVKLPLSKVGLELSRILANLGIINDFSVGQRLARVRSHARLWDPSAPRISSTADAAGYPAMYLTLHLNYDRHKPLWSRATLAAAPQQPTASSSSSSQAAAVPSPQVFAPPVGINAPTPESIKLFSKPSVQRWIGVQELLTARRNTRPGIFLLSTPQGLLTDIDCELRGIGGTLLAHLGLPMGHVIQLRGLLRTKYLQELQAALPPGSNPLTPAALTSTSSSSGGSGTDAVSSDVMRAKLRARHTPLAEWDARSASVAGLVERLDAVRAAAGEYLQYCDELREGPDSSTPRALLTQAQRLMVDLQVQQAAWERQQRHGSSGSGSSRGAHAHSEGSSGGSKSSRRADGQSSDSRVEQEGGESVRRRRSGLFASRQQQEEGQQQQQQQRRQRDLAGQDRWQPSPSTDDDSSA